VQPTITCVAGTERRSVIAASRPKAVVGILIYLPTVIMSVPLVVFSCSKRMNDLLKRDRVCPSSQCDAVLLAAARVEHQSWPEVRMHLPEEWRTLGWAIPFEPAYKSALASACDAP
jgi:hypothetical protein